MALTFGKTTKGLTEEEAPGKYIRATKFTSSQAGSIASISLYVKQKPTHNPAIKCAIYDSSFNLLANGTTEAIEVPTDQDGWMVFNFATPPTVTASTDYYLAFWFGTITNPRIYIYYDAGSTDQLAYDEIAYDGYPDPLVPDAYVDYDLSIYATYGAGDITVQPSILALTSAILSPTVKFGSKISPSTLLATLAVLTPRFVGNPSQHSGFITSDETWYKADSPHVITAVLQVQNGATLTIEAGCEIHYTNYDLQINDGTIIAEGISSDWIVFKAKPETTPSFARMIELYDSVSGANCSIKYCEFDVTGFADGALPIIKYFVAGITSVDHVLIYGDNIEPINFLGIMASDGATLDLDHITISGIHKGIYTIASGIINIKNSIVASCKYGLYNGAGTINSIYNDVWNNITDYHNCSSGTGDISEDPLFVGGDPYDYNLQGASPCLSSGEGGTYMGAFAPGLVLKNFINDFRIAGALTRSDIINDFRLSGATLSDIINDFRIGGIFSFVHIINDFRSRLTSLSNVLNKFNIAKEIIKNINNKFNLVLEPAKFMADIINKFNLAKAKICDVTNDVRTHKKEINDISNDFRMVAPWQIIPH